MLNLTYFILGGGLQISGGIHVLLQAYVTSWTRDENPEAKARVVEESNYEKENETLK